MYATLNLYMLYVHHHLPRKLARDPGAAENDDFLMYAGKNVSRPPNHASNFATILSKWLPVPT